MGVGGDWEWPEENKRDKNHSHRLGLDLACLDSDQDATGHAVTSRRTRSRRANISPKRKFRFSEVTQHSSEYQTSSPLDLDINHHIPILLLLHISATMAIKGSKKRAAHPVQVRSLRLSPLT